MQFRTVKVRRDPTCPACGTREIRSLREEAVDCPLPQGAAAIPEITPRDLSDRLRRGDPLTLVDVREPHEWALDRIPGAVLAPLSRLEAEAARLDRDREIVAYCRSGVRSQTAGHRLRAAGFDRVLSLAGGILRYRAEVGPVPNED